MGLDKINQTCVAAAVSRRLPRLFCGLAFAAVALWTPAAERADSLSVTLGEVEASGAGPSARVGADGTVRFGTAALAKAPQMFGESDHLRFIRQLPGVGSVSDYSSGSSIDGMSYGQNAYSVNGIPVHFPYHFGGIFSVFNPRIYRDAELGRSARSAGSADVLGGAVNLESAGAPRRRLGGEVNAGMLSSSAYAAVPLAGGKGSVEAAGRVSYIDALYKSFLRMDRSQARYEFGDFDAVAIMAPSESDRLRLTLHWNRDHVGYDDELYSLGTVMDWHNVAAGAEWTHEADGWDMTNTAYFSRFANRLAMDMGGIRLRAPTSVQEWGLKGSAAVGELAEGLNLDGGYSAQLWRLVPQGAEVTGFGAGSRSVPAARRAFAAKVWAEAEWRFGSRWSLRAGLAVPAYAGEEGYRSVTADPRVTLTRSLGRGHVGLHAGRYHQFIHQVGFSEMGLSSDFRIGATRSNPAQESWNVVVNGAVRPLPWLSLSADLYWKRVFNDPEYTGAVLDIVNPDYDCGRYIVSSSGHSAGAGLLARAEAGRLWAMASYSFGVARRKSPLTGAWFNALSDIRHSLSVSAAWEITAHWSLTGSFSYASGRRVTPIDAIYFIAGRLMMEYGERNSARLPDYHRLDLGAAYRFATGGRVPLRHEVSLSVLNAYGHRNVEMSTLRVNMDSGMYERHEVGSLFRWLPSLSYSVKF